MVLFCLKLLYQFSATIMSVFGCGWLGWKKIVIEKKIRLMFLSFSLVSWVNHQKLITVCFSFVKITFS